MRAHVIKDGIVVNTIEVNSFDVLPGLIDASLGGKMGDLWDGAHFSTPPKYASVAEAKAARIAELAAYRYARETAGIMIGETLVRTDRESQALLTGAKSGSDLNPDALIDWKGANGWVQIDRATLVTIGQAVWSHVQACFSRECAHAKELDKLETITDIETYDITSGWPE